MHHSHLRLALAAALTACLPANAAEWVAEPSVSLRQSYDDNLRLTSGAHDSVWGTSLDPSLKLSRRSELWDINGSARLHSSKFVGEDGADSNDSYLATAIARQFERGSFNANASQVNDTTLQTETLDLDTGLTNIQIDRAQRGLQLAGSYMFTESTWLEASVAHSAISYDQGELYGLLDYDYLTPSLSVVHQLDPQLQLFGTLDRTVVKYDNNSTLESTTDSLQLGTEYAITETWKVRGSVGSRRTSTSETVPTIVPRPGLEFLFPSVYNLAYVPRDSESTGLVYDASLSRAFEAGSLSMNVSQSVSPSSTGTDTESTQFGFSGTRAFSAKLSAQLAVSYYQSSTIGDVTTSADNTSYRISPSLSWHLKEDLMLNAGYSYTSVKRNVANDESTDNNNVSVSLDYSWPRIAVSR